MASMAVRWSLLLAAALAAMGSGETPPLESGDATTPVAAPSLRAAEPEPTPVHLAVSVPEPASQRTLPLPWIEVKGYAWTGESPFIDIALLLDLSASTLVASGEDIDGDGRRGRIHPDAYWIFLGYPYRYEPRLLSSDPHDTVAMAELGAAERFVATSDFERTRIALLTFDDNATVRAELGASREELLDTLARLKRLEKRRARDFERRGTHFGEAIATATVVLERGVTEVPRRRQVLLLSDGMPSLPRPSRRAARRAAATALVVEERGTNVHFFPLGAVALRYAPFFEYMDEHFGTQHTKVGRMGEIAEKLAEARLDRLEALEVHNRSADAQARTLRLFADGSFDAIAPLVPGRNELVFVARTRDGSSTERVHVVDYVPTEARTPEEARDQREAIADFATRLHARRAETELLAEIDRAQGEALEQERRLTIELDGRDAPAREPSAEAETD